MSRILLSWAFVVCVGCGGSVTEAPLTGTDAGADGTPADVAPAETVLSDGGCPCLSAQLSWEQNGGLVPYYDRSTLTGCNDYALERVDPATGKPTLECKDELRNCSGDYMDADDTWSVPDVNAALRDADVKAALAAAPVLYGVDPRAYDGTVFQVKIDGKVIEVGGDCGTTPGCKPIPAGLTQLKSMLTELEADKRMVVCSSFK